jgi:hypothetical protein
VTRQIIPFAAADISALAKSLRGQLLARESPPSHVEMLNMLARASGHRNFQHLRAGAADRAAEAPQQASDPAAVTRAAACFDAQGRLARWPGKLSQQGLCVWVLWAQLPARRVLTEPQVNALIEARHLFGDYALLRRCLCDRGLFARTVDGREYRRIEREPPPEAAALIRRVLSPSSA